MVETGHKRILYAASTQSHLERFHMPYIQALKRKNTVLTMANGKSVDFPITFDKHFFSLTNIKCIFQIRKILKKEQFDMAILHTTLASFLIRAAMIGMRKRPYTVRVVHGYLFPLNGKGLKNKILLLCEKLVKGKTDHLAAMNQEDFAIAQKHRLCKGSVVMTRGMGVSMDVTVPLRDEILRAQYITKSTAFLAIFVGELSHRKNQSFLLQGVRRLQDIGVRMGLVLVGDGASRSELEHEIDALGLRDCVFAVGNQEPVTPYLSIADLYVSSSISEGLPFNVMEAMSCGLPIIASDVKGQNDLLRDSPGTLYPLGDLDAFCNAVCAIYRSQKMGVGTQEYPQLAQYRLEAVFEETLAAITNHIER